MIQIEFQFLSEVELLLGFRVVKYNNCDGENEEGKLIINRYYDVQFGLIFGMVTATIRTRTTMLVDKDQVLMKKGS